MSAYRRYPNNQNAFAPDERGIPTDRFGRKRIVAGAARQGIRGAQYDTSGNIVGGAYMRDVMIDGQEVAAGSPVQPSRGAATTPLDDYKAGSRTPMLDAFMAGNQRMQQIKKDEATAKEQAAYAGLNPEQQKEQQKKDEMMALPRENWGKLEWRDQVKAYNQDPTLKVPMPGKTKAMDARLASARAKVDDENRARNKEQAANVAARSAFDRSDPTRVVMKPEAQASANASFQQAKADREALAAKKKSAFAPA
jgi:membrane protein involved in colicin uptake